MAFPVLVLDRTTRRLLTLPKAAKETGMPYGELLRLANAGILPAFKLPARRSWLIDLADLYAYLDTLKPATAPVTEDETVLSQTTENVAPQKRGQRGKINGAPDGKYQWMRRLGRVV